MKLLRLHTFVVVCLMLTGTAFAQSGSGLKGKRSSKREIQKRQQEADQKEAEQTPFAPSEQSGRETAQVRDDLLWPAESGNTVYQHAGNLSVMAPARYGILDGLEAESYLGLARWVPNLFVKKRWRQGRWYVASRHGIYSATPGYRYYQSEGNTVYAQPDDAIPMILSTKNQLIVSRVYRDYLGCRGRQPYLIISGGIGVDFGVPLGENDLRETNKHFLANRSIALTGNDYLAHLFVRADYQYSPAWVFSGSLKYFRGNFTGHNAFEQHLAAEGFVSDNLSFTFGIQFSEAAYNTPNRIGIAPMLDICWYLGTKKARDMGLYDQNFKMTKYKTHKNKKLNRDTNRRRYQKYF